MMNFIYNIMMMSVSGSIMYLLSLIFYSRTGRKYAGMFYAMLTAAIGILIIPLNFLPRLYNVTVSDISAVYSEGTAASPAAAAQAFNPDILIFTIWALPAVILLVKTIAGYMKTRHILLHASEQIYDQSILDTFVAAEAALKTSGNIEIRKTNGIKSPLLFGIIKPYIILPNREFSEYELRMVFLHELTHYRHKDLLIKLLCSAALCVHWFNPAVYFIRRSVNRACELCCDEAVVAVLNDEDKKPYGRLIISVIESTTCSRLVYTTAMASPRQSIQYRLLKIIEFKKPSAAVKLISTVTFLAMLVCSVTAFGFEAAVNNMPAPIKAELSAALPSASPSPTDKALSESETPAPEPETTQTAEPSREVIKQTVEPTAHPTPKASEMPISTATPVPPSPNEINITETSYIFAPSFAQNSIIKSDIITANDDTYIKISKSSVPKNVYITVYDAETNEVIFDEETESYVSNTFNISIAKGKKIYFTAKSIQGSESASYYIGAK